MNASETYTIEQFTKINSDIITYNNLSLYDMNSILNKPMVCYNLLNDYMDELLDNCVTVTLTAQDRQRYDYKPKLLAYDIYGSTELYFIILLLNNICDVKDFTFDKLNVIRKEELMNILSYIYNSESETISSNRQKNV